MLYECEINYLIFLKKYFCESIANLPFDARPHSRFILLQRNIAQIAQNRLQTGLVCVLHSAEISESNKFPEIRSHMRRLPQRFQPIDAQQVRALGECEFMDARYHFSWWMVE